MSTLRDQRKVAKLQKKIKKIEGKKENFWSNGISEREYLLVVTTTIFFLFVSIGLILLLLHRSIDEMYLLLLDMVSPVVMTIVASVAGIDITGKITTSVRERKNKKVNELVEDDMVYDEKTFEEEYDPYKNGI